VGVRANKAPLGSMAFCSDMMMVLHGSIISGCIFYRSGQWQLCVKRTCSILQPVKLDNRRCNDLNIIADQLR